MEEQKFYYISLVHALIGKCIRVDALDIEDVRRYAYEYLGRYWCSVYEEQGTMEVIGQTILL